MKIIMSFVLLIVVVFPVNAASVTTPGAITSLIELPGARFHYDPVSDVSTFVKGQQTRISLTVLPAVDPVFALKEILTSMDAGQYQSKIKKLTIAGFGAADVHVKQQTSDWLLVVKSGDLNLFIRAQDVNNARAHKANIEKLVKLIKFSPARRPALVSGHYTMSNSYNSSHDYSTGSNFGTYSENSITLQSDGRFSTSSHVGVSGSGVSGYSEGTGEQGWWQVRGNRILAYEPPNTFYNYRFEAFSNGLEVFDESNEKLLWVRQ